jgi:hypothetical protein
MQIVSGACLFVIAVILLAYVPGKLLLIALAGRLPTRRSNPACFLIDRERCGLLVDFDAHLARFFVWPWNRRRLSVYLANKNTVARPIEDRIAVGRERLLPRDRSGVALAGVIALIIVMAFLPFITRILPRTDGPCAPIRCPTSLHIAIVKRIDAHNPAAGLALSGHPLSITMEWMLPSPCLPTLA